MNSTALLFILETVGWQHWLDGLKKKLRSQW
jgi:hypothetical protein